MMRFAAAVCVCLVLAACASQPKEAAVQLPPAPRPGEPSGLIGLNGASLRASFGAPAFVRNDGAAEMWRYDGAACKAFFFLYVENGERRVRHVETIPHSGTAAADASCLQLLLKTPQPVS
ncbi:MAG TPA: hypothetical protein VGG10_22865 [Rhizomicrobium sp.]|jgi:hypothetical protein